MLRGMVEQLDFTLERGTDVPLYQQLADQIRAAIDGGRLQPGAAFENEVALAQRLGLSRPTVRRAMADLVAQGLLLRRRGHGTTVASPRIHRRAALTSLYDDLDRAGAVPRTEVLDLEVVTDSHAARELGLDAHEPFTAITRLRLTDGRPFALLHNWIPLSLGQIDARQLEGLGLYALLRERGVHPVVAHQTIGARRPTAPESRRLRLKPSDPVLTMCRSAFDAQGRPVELGDHVYDADGYTIDVMLDER